MDTKVRVMIISERIFKIIKEKNLTQTEFAKRAGIATSTISEWKKKKTTHKEINSFLTKENK